MALNGDFLTLEGVFQIAEEGQEEVYNLMGSKSQLEFRKKILEDTLNKLNRLIELFQAAEAQVLSQLNAKNLLDLENRFKKFYSESGYSQFTNIDIAKTIKAEFEAATDESKADLREKYITILNNLVIEAANTVPKDKRFQENAQAAIITEVGRLLKKFGFDRGMKTTGSGRGGITVTSKIIKWDENGNLSFFPELATSIITARLDNMMIKASNEAALKAKGNYSPADLEQLKRLTDMSTKSQVGKTNASVNIGFTIGKLTGGATQTDAKLWDKNTLTLKNNQIRYAIVLQMPTQYRMTADRIIQQMLNQNEYMFYIGKSAEQLKGVLGEVAAMHAIADLLGMDKPNDEIINWVATNLKGGKQLSIDIILKNFTTVKFENTDIDSKFGIQIKNVESNRVNFVDASMDTIMNKLGLEPQHLEDVFFSDDFNIGYEYDLTSQKYVPMFSWKNRLYNYVGFLQAENMIDEAVEDIRSFLKLYSAEFVYMGFDDSFIDSLATLSNELESIGGNILYIVRDTPFFASEMLIQIRDALAQTMSQAAAGPLKIENYIAKLDSDNKQAVNIINYKNSHNTVEDLKKHKVKLTSSYLFSK